MSSAAELFSDVRARFQKPDLGVSEHGRLPFSFFMCWLSEALHALPKDEQEAFEHLAGAYIDGHLEHTVHKANRVLTFEHALRLLHPLVEARHHGLHIGYNRSTLKAANYKLLKARFEAGPALESVSFSGMKLERTAALLKTLQAHPNLALKSMKFSVDGELRRQPEQLAPVHELLWSFVPDDLTFLASGDAFYREDLAALTQDALLTNLPRLTALEELAWTQHMTPAQLDQLLDALPVTLTALSLRIFLSNRKKEDELEPYLEILRAHPRIPKLKRLRIGALEAEQINRVEQLDSIKNLDQYMLQWPFMRPANEPVYTPWDDPKEMRRQALANESSEEPVVDTTMGILRFESSTSQTLTVMRHALLVSDDATRPRVYPNLTHANLFNLTQDTLELLVKSGPLAFPHITSMNMSLQESGPSFEPQGVFDQLPAWTKLGRMNIDCEKKGAKSLERLWGAIEEVPDVPPIFPELEILQLSLWPDSCRAFLRLIPKIMPKLAHLQIKPQQGYKMEHLMPRLFDVIIELRTWEHVPRVSMYLSDYMPSLDAKTPTMKYWVQQSLNEELPDNLRRHILRMMFSKEAKKQVMLDLYGPLYGVKLAKSWTRDVIITALLDSLPPTLRDYTQI